MKLFFSIFIALCISVVYTTKARYDGCKVFTLKVKTEDQLIKLTELSETFDGYDFWSDPSIGGLTDIMVPPHLISHFEEVINLLKLDVNLKVEDVQKLIDSEQPKVKPRAAFDWNAYYTLDEIYAWLDEQVAKYPFLTQTVIGNSFEGRQMRALKLSKKTGNPAIFIEANIHAREWITSATVTYFLNELLTSTTLEMQDLANNIDWYIIPVANPDGFTYCHTTERLWRKTRSTTSNILCRGADPNRNFGFNWMTGGASNNPCSDTYAGPSEFSEIETRNIRDFANQVKGNTRIYLAFHSYGQYVLLPWGHTTAPSADHAKLMEIGNAARDGFAQLANTPYTVGSTASVLYVASGGSADWATGALGIPVSFTFEFRDRGANGFVLPANQIIPNGQETVAAIIKTVAKSRELGYL